MPRIMTKKVLHANLIEHPAVKFWHRLGLNSVKPEEIVILKEVDGFTFKEIADIKNMPENTVKTKLYSTLKQLKQLIEEGGNQ